MAGATISVRESLASVSTSMHVASVNLDFHDKQFRLRKIEVVILFRFG